MVLSILLYTNLGLDWAQTMEKDVEGWVPIQFSNEIKQKGSSIVDSEHSEYSRLHMIKIEYVALSLAKHYSLSKKQHLES